MLNKYLVNFLSNFDIQRNKAVKKKGKSYNCY